MKKDEVQTGTAEANAKVGESEREATRANTGTHGSKKPGRKGKGKGAKPDKNATRANTGAQGAKMSGLDAAAKVLAEAGEPLNCKQMVERAFEKGYWQSGGKTPHATIYSAILREIQKNGESARFRKAERGKFGALVKTSQG